MLLFNWWSLHHRLFNFVLGSPTYTDTSRSLTRTTIISLDNNVWTRWIFPITPIALCVTESIQEVLKMQFIRTAIQFTLVRSYHCCGVDSGGWELVLCDVVIGHPSIRDSGWHFPLVSAIRVVIWDVLNVSRIHQCTAKHFPILNGGIDKLCGVLGGVASHCVERVRLLGDWQLRYT